MHPATVLMITIAISVWLLSRLLSRGRRRPLGAADPSTLDFANLGFDYVQTRSLVRCDWSAESGWSSPRAQTDPTLSVHPMSSAFHYGQALFEGLKAFRTADGGAHIVNPTQNAARLARGCERLAIPPPPMELFIDAVKTAVEDNADYIPPYGSNGALYIRPFVFGHGAKLGLGAAPTYTFCVVVSPVGEYYASGAQKVPGCVIEDFDRAAPRGVGNVKAAGNYAADLMPAAEAAEAGYSIGLYLDAATRTFVEEFSTSNFIAITGDGSTYVTPSSDTILPSITNTMLQQLAADHGLRVERRPIPWDEVASFREVAACGTAVVLKSIQSLARGGEVADFGGRFETFRALYNRFRAIQVGDEPDVHNWCVPVAA